MNPQTFYILNLLLLLTIPYIDIKIEGKIPNVLLILLMLSLIYNGYKFGISTLIFSIIVIIACVFINPEYYLFKFLPLIIYFS